MVLFVLVVTELNLTTAVCKNLYENNVTLKTKHKALLAVIPGTPGSSDIDFPSLPPSPLSRTPSNYFSSLPRSNANSLGPSLQPMIRRSRKISVSPSDIALLSDQNAELLEKLEKLETESAQADQVGRRALKRLEKDIQILREELERTQARSEELEEKTRAGFGKGAEKVVEEAWRRKKEREAKFRALRKKGDAFSGEGDIRDFAPGSGLASAAWSDRLSPSKSGDRNEIVSPYDLDSSSSSEAISPHALSGLDNDGFSPFYGPSQEEAMPTLPLPQEYALVSQLLSKIQELEETNAQIKEQQAETVIKLQSVQRETENITKLYECLGDPSNVEWVVDEEQEKTQNVKKRKDDNTIRFKSLRRTLEGDVSATADTDVFTGEITAKPPSQGGYPVNFNAYKTRKSVVGLFDLGHGPGNQEPSASGNFATPSALGLEMGDIRSWPTEATSPALSDLSLQAPLHTLGSELGSEFGEDWGTNAGNHHLRTTSLENLSDVAQLSPSPMPAQFSSSFATEDSQTPVSMGRNGLQLTLETPTPTPERSKASGGTRHTPRYHRMSQTIHSRTKRWVDGRFKDSPTGIKNSGDPGESITEPVSGKFATAIDAVVETFMGRPPEDETGEEVTQPELPTGPPSKTSTKRERRAAVAVVLEVWLWLQFAVIILVFLWAMAKRGPKTVLKDAERRRLRAGI